MKRQVIAAAFVAVSAGGCGSIVRGTDEPVAFLSDPPGAQVVTTKGYACPLTPCSIKVDRSDEFDATISKPGYASQIVQVRTKVAGAGGASFAGNVLAGGVIGMGVDAATGASLDHTPNPVSVTLIPEGRSAPVSRGRRRVQPEG
ncbi:translation initiation factor 2 [Methylobacterium brachiatum]|uniref:translation initiation factor 2 n=1 Tax=Methylobacterium brachiatum TaxID=269660 RepID=UPI000EFD3171|nr:translation initiation factor 2 [Methylobacterium brachiatum]AYO83670.1 translation initiation factor 2 [Methylobacterium brachiatum]